MSILESGFLVLFLYMSALCILALARKNNGIADVGYGVAFIALIGSALLLGGAPNGYALALAILPLVWGTRLALRIFLKNHGKPEDFRYAAWRKAWGKNFAARSFFQIYMLQGAVVGIIALPVLLSLVYGALNPNPLLFILGLILWIVGFFFETMADFQLDRFIFNREHAGHVMTEGLWRYSRHPNYFGESLMWFAIAVAASGLSSLPFLGFISPLLITFLLLKVSGVPMLEKRFSGNPEWEAYKARTSVFIPLPPK